MKHELSVGYTYYGYDENGSLTALQTPSGTTYFEYGDHGLCTTIIPPTGDSAYFDYDGRLTRYHIKEGSTSTYFTHDGLNILEFDEDGTKTVLTHGATRVAGTNSVVEMDKDGTTYFLLNDGRGSTAMILDANKSEVWSGLVDAFGTALASSGTNPSIFWYQGQAWITKVIGGRRYFISSGRVVDAEDGRALQRDWDGGYSAFANNPVRFVDPDGWYERYFEPMPRAGYEPSERDKQLCLRKNCLEWPPALTSAARAQSRDASIQIPLANYWRRHCRCVYLDYAKWAEKIMCYYEYPVPREEWGQPSGRDPDALNRLLAALGGRNPALAREAYQRVINQIIAERMRAFGRAMGEVPGTGFFVRNVDAIGNVALTAMTIALLGAYAASRELTRAGMAHALRRSLARETMRRAVELRVAEQAALQAAARRELARRLLAAAMVGAVQYHQELQEVAASITYGLSGTETGVPSVTDFGRGYELMQRAGILLQRAIGRYREETPRRQPRGDPRQGG